MQLVDDASGGLLSCIFKYLCEIFVGFQVLLKMLNAILAFLILAILLILTASHLQQLGHILHLLVAM